jgi:acid phosphatase type 7
VSGRRRARLVPAAVAVGCAVAVIAGTSLATAGEPRSTETACPPGSEQHPFVDVAGSVHEQAIGCAVSWELTQGTTATTYSPEAPVTRGQVASFLDRLVTAAGGSLPDPTQDHFDDDDGSTHEPSIDRLAEAGIVRGVGPRTYRPADPVTRAQSVALVVRTYDHLAAQADAAPLPAGPDAFDDDDGSVLEPDIDRAAAAGLAAGTGPRTFSPQLPVRRDQAASLLVRVLDLALAEGLADPPPAGPTAPAQPEPTSEPTAEPTPTTEPTTEPTEPGDEPTGEPTTDPSTEPTTEPQPEPSVPPITVVAAADVACPPGKAETATTCQHARTADLVGAIDPHAVLLPGDIQNDDGSVAEYTEPGGWTGTWSRFLDRSWPTTGNRDWYTADAAGYRHVFDGRTGGRFWYSVDIGGWHVVSLSSDCRHVGGCDVGSPQHDWFVQDLAAHDGKPTLVFWHHPRFSAGWTGSLTRVDAFWRTAAADPDVQLVLWGHDHSYQRLAPRDADGSVDPAGLRAFAVGTGGQDLHCWDRHADAVDAEVYDCTSFGVLRLDLRPDGYDWQFVAATGSQDDRGSSGLRPRG